MALADQDSGFPAAGEIAVVPLLAACVAFGQADALGVHVLLGTAQPAAVAVVAADGTPAAGHSQVLAELGNLQAAAALLGIPVVGKVPDKTAENASGAHQSHELDKTVNVVVLGHAVQGTHGEVLGYAVQRLVVVFVGGLMADKVVCDCCVVHTADNLDVVVVVVVVVVHGKETGVAVAAVVAAIGELEIDFPVPEQIENKYTVEPR